jgi:hypothetical protein
MSELAPTATRTADALAALQTDEPGAIDALVAASDAGEEVFVPVTGDGTTPNGMTDERGPALVAFTDLELLEWALPEGPRIAVVPLPTILGASVQSGAPIRLDATSSREVRIEPSAAAAMIEGAVPDGGVRTEGGRYDPPSVDDAPPDTIGASPPPPHDVPAYYGVTSGSPVDEDTARRSHEEGKPYRAVVPADPSNERTVSVALTITPQRTVSEVRDEQGRPVMITRFSRRGDHLFHDRLDTLDYLDDALEPIQRIVMQYRPDGVMRFSTCSDGGVDSTDSYGIDVEHLWVPALTFGDYRWVLGPR